METGAEAIAANAKIAAALNLPYESTVPTSGAVRGRRPRRPSRAQRQDWTLDWSAFWTIPVGSDTEVAALWDADAIEPHFQQSWSSGDSNGRSRRLVGSERPFFGTWRAMLVRPFVGLFGQS